MTHWVYLARHFCARCGAEAARAFLTRKRRRWYVLVYGHECGPDETRISPGRAS